MRFEWNDDKNRRNLEKHGISFETASFAFEDPYALTDRDIFDEEQRWNTLASIAPGVVLFIVHTWMDKGSEEVIRLISVRAAESRERKKYEEAQRAAKTRDRGHRRKGRRRH
jgi:uncharacterized DUF497 family protein